MSARVVAVVGAGSSFALAAIAGVLGNQLGPGAWWTWAAFLAVLLIGTAVTAIAAYRAAAKPTGPPPAGVSHSGHATVGKVTAHSGPAVGVNYGTVTHSQRTRGGRR